MNEGTAVCAQSYPRFPSFLPSVLARTVLLLKEAQHRIGGFLPYLTDGCTILGRRHQTRRKECQNASKKVWYIQSRRRHRGQKVKYRILTDVMCCVVQSMEGLCDQCATSRHFFHCLSHKWTLLWAIASGDVVVVPGASTVSFFLVSGI